jgi:saccharopine dehydrogenase (NAD+, L-lysine forming)
VAVTIGIRREDKNRWERRVPLTPAAVAHLKQATGASVIVQPSPIRVFEDDEYRVTGARVIEDLDAAQLVLAVKEVPMDLMRQGKIYVCFAHVIKGQKQNMPMLRRLIDLGCTLIDYEKITDAQNRRLVFFGVHAGHAGMIDTLWCLGQRLKNRGIATPLADVRRAYEYRDLADARDHLMLVGDQLLRQTREKQVGSIIVGISGYGNVSRGAQDVLDYLPTTAVEVRDLPGAAAQVSSAGAPIIKVVFREEHMVTPRESDSRFDLQDYYQHPERYQGTFERHLPHLDVLVNTIYWEPRYPRLVTRDWVRRAYRQGQRPRLSVIGDISCDVEGSIEITLQNTEPDAPCYVYDATSDTIRMGVEGEGPVVLAVDNLPCEMPREASEYFSQSLMAFVTDMARADWTVDYERLALPPALKKAVVVHRGQLTPSFHYLEPHLVGVK